MEEATIAAARPPTVAALKTEPDFVEEEIPTQQLVMPAAAAQNLIEVNETTAQEIQNPLVNPVETADRIVEVPVYEEPIEETSSGKMSRLLSSILWLILGGILGAGIYYLLSSNNRQPEIAPVPQLTQQSPNIEFSSFETLRRSVDNDPNSFINRNANTTMDTESLYLLGRAYLLTGKFPEAKKYLEEAKNKLAQANVVNNRVLANDIALGLSIIDEAAAQNKFQSQIKPSSPNANSQINGNSNMSIR